MEVVLFSITALILGFGIGAEVTKRHFYSKNIGNLRVDRSIENDGPYLFLEVTRGNVDKIQQDHFVLLKVLNENYIPRK